MRIICAARMHRPVNGRCLVCTHAITCRREADTYVRLHKPGANGTPAFSQAFSRVRAAHGQVRNAHRPDAPPQAGAGAFRARTEQRAAARQARTCNARTGCNGTPAFLSASLHRQGTDGSACGVSCPFLPPMRQRRLTCGARRASLCGFAWIAQADTTGTSAPAARLGGLSGPSPV